MPKSILVGIYNQFKFLVERLLLKGAHFQLLLIAILIVLVSVIAGALVFFFSEIFKNFFDAAWWAFLRLSDPGYLGDDQGFLHRTVSTIVTILGYVLFMGALIAIMTQWLNATMKRLESGMTPVRLKGHVLILGYTNRTKTVVREIAASQGRLKRFLRRIGAKRLRITILAEEVGSRLVAELRDEMGEYWDPSQIVLRSGNPLRIEHLQRVDFMNAGSIIIPGTDLVPSGFEMIDTQIVKVLLSITKYGTPDHDNPLPLVVAELFDERKMPAARSAYQGPLELISSESIICRLMAQNIRHRGLSFIYSELISYSEGNVIYIREIPGLQGMRPQDIIDAFPSAILLGVLRPSPTGLKPLLNPRDGFSLTDGDRLVFLAESFKDTEPRSGFSPGASDRNSPMAPLEKNKRRRILFLGWNRKISSLLKELDSYVGERFDVDILSTTPVTEREEHIASFCKKFENVEIEHLSGDYTVPTHLENLHPHEYDNILMLSRDWAESGEEADARTIFGYILLRDILPQQSKKPEILIELMDPDNDKLFAKRNGEVMITPLIISHILAHVALRPDLNRVFDELFTNGGAELYFRPAIDYGIDCGTTTFSQIMDIVLKAGDTAVGIRKFACLQDSRGGIELNPDRRQPLIIEENDEVVVLTTYD